MENMLKDKVAIITGSGRGIGQAAAKLFAGEGAKVVVNDIDPEPVEQTVSEINKAGGEAIAYVGDVSSPDFAEGIVRKAGETWGGIHIIVNNAGFTWDSVIQNITDEQWDTIMNIHIKAPFRLIRAAAPYFRDAAKKEMEDGKPIARKIINVSSMAGTCGNAGQANYSAAKSANHGLTKTMAKEWGRFNVQVNCIAFGLVETRLSASKEKGGSVEWEGKKIALGIPNSIHQMASMMIPLGRSGTPEEAAGGMLFFASPMSDYVSGQIMLVGGGLEM